MTTYAVTGVTGHLGRIAVERLLERGVPAADVVGLARDPEKADELVQLGIHVREGDYDRPGTLDDALAGVDRLLFVSGSEVGQRVRQHTNVVNAAARAGVERILYTSILRAGTTDLVLAPEHQATEEAIVAAGLRHTFLRNSWYTENYTGRLPEYVEQGVILGATDNGRIAAAPRADYAEAAVAALLEDRTDDAVYELAGPAFTFDELAATVTEVTGTPVRHENLSPEDYTAALTGVGLDEGTAGFVVALDRGIAAGQLDGDPADLERLLGRPATTMPDAVRAAWADRNQAG